MINRELIRIKVVQLTYAFYQNPDKTIDSAERELFTSLSKSYDLYLSLLGLIPTLLNIGRRRYELDCARAERENLPKPSDKFINNAFALQVEKNNQLSNFLLDESNRWDYYEDMLKKLYSLIVTSEPYKQYMATEERSYDEDRELWRKLYRMFIENNDDIDYILEEKNIYWNDDKYIVDSFVLKTIKFFKEENGADQPLLDDYDSEEDKEFARTLFHTSIRNADEYREMMAQCSKHWDTSRMAFMDIIIMQVAIAEMIRMKNIPLSITINMYVELAKLYSTNKSGSFVNGMLDNIAHKLVKERKVLKMLPDKKL